MRALRPAGPVRSHIADLAATLTREASTKANSRTFFLQSTGLGQRSPTLTSRRIHTSALSSYLISTSQVQHLLPKPRTPSSLSLSLPSPRFLATQTMSQPEVLLFGLGAIGGFYASVLKRSGKCAVSVVARSNYEKVKEKGLIVNSDKLGEGHFVFDGVFRDTTAAAASGRQFDYILCANKALLDAKPSLADQLAPIITPGKTAIVLLQNGVGNEEPLHKAFPDTTIISAVVWTGGKVLPDAEDGTPSVHQFVNEGLTIGVDYRAPADDKVKAAEDAQLDGIVDILEAGGGAANRTTDIQSEKWVKVIWNCAWNTLTTVTRVRTNHIFGASEGAVGLSRQLMDEVVAVATAKGLNMPADIVTSHLDRCRGVGGAGLPSSMMMDNEAGRPMEVEVILGTPVREGKRLGVPTPILETLYTIIKALDWRNAHPEEAAAKGPA